MSNIQFASCASISASDNLHDSIFSEWMTLDFVRPFSSSQTFSSPGVDGLDDNVVDLSDPYMQGF